MKARVAIVGGGVGGTVVANRLRRALHGEAKHEVEITVFDELGRHPYQPGWLYIPFGHSDPHLEHSETRLLHHDIHLLTGNTGRVETIDKNRKELTTADGVTHSFDFLVFATGSRNYYDEIPGFAEGANHFYDQESSLALREKLDNFKGGKIVVGVSSIPHRCPPAPLEFTFLLEDSLRQRGLREETEIHYLYPINRVFTIESVDAFARPLLEERNINIHTFFNVDTIDPEKKIVSSLEGDELSYDLLVLTPPHRGSKIAQSSGFGDNEGWIPTNRNTLRMKGYEDAGFFAVGDATDVPVSKAGASAHFEGLVVGDEIAADILHRPIKEEYKGKVTCFLETGHNQASILFFDYEHPPKPPKPSIAWHLGKAAFNRFYYQIVPPAIL